MIIKLNFYYSLFLIIEIIIKIIYVSNRLKENISLNPKNIRLANFKYQYKIQNILLIKILIKINY